MVLSTGNEENTATPTATLQPTPSMSLEEVCMHIHAISVEIRMMTERMWQTIERNKAWLARIKTLSVSLWVLCQ